MGRQAEVRANWEFDPIFRQLSISPVGIQLTNLPGRLGIPQDRLSGYEKFEAPDPAAWTARGYAIVNIDSRGSWDSEGYLWYVNTPGRI